jgi:hypothetical protein
MGQKRPKVPLNEVAALAFIAAVGDNRRGRSCRSDATICASAGLKVASPWLMVKRGDRE